MAASHLDLSQVIREEIKCAICHDLITNPKVLTCLHSFCLKCLQDQIDDSENAAQIACPLCRTSTLIPQDGVAGLQTNFTMSNLKEALKLHENSEPAQSIKCENGLDDNIAIAHCTNCECYLCQECYQQHGKLKATRGHNVVLLADIKKDVRKYEPKRFCLDHDREELKMYCKDDHKVICRDCALVTHKGHDYGFIKDICPELKAQLKSEIDEVQMKCDEFGDHIAYITAVTEECNENITNRRKEICDYFDSYIERLKAKQKELIDTLEHAQEERSSQISAQREIVETSQAKLVSGVEFGNQLVERGIPVDIAMTYKLAHDRLVSLKEEKWDRDLVQPSKWKFVPADDNDPFRCKVRGHVNNNDVIVENLSQPLPGDNKFSVRIDTEVDVLHSNLVVTVINTETGENRNVTVKKAERGWNVTYNIEESGKYAISVAVDGVEAQNSPFIREWKEKLENGVKVRRGKDWKWGEQDGGVDTIGTVMGWSDEVGASNNWVKIKWDNSNRQNNYRWGAEGAFDLEIVPQ